MKIFLWGLVLFSLITLLVSFAKITNSIAPDFSVFYFGAKDLIVGQNPYRDTSLFTGIGYPPMTLVFYLPLTILPYPVAQFFWLILSFLCLLGAVYLSLKISFGQFSWEKFGMFLTFALLAFPTKFTFGMGQSNLVVLFLLLLAFSFWQGKINILAGITLGLACIVKPLFVFFLFFLVINQAWKVIFFSLLTIIIFILVSLIIINPNLYLFYLTEVIPPLLNPTGREIYYNQGIMGAVSRQITDLSQRRETFVIGSLILLGITFRVIKKSKPRDGLAVFLPTVLLIDTLSWQHHFVWLIPPFITIYNSFRGAQKILPKLILGLSYILVAINFKEPTVFSSHVFWGTLILWGLGIYCLRKTNVNI